MKKIVIERSVVTRFIFYGSTKYMASSTHPTNYNLLLYLKKKKSEGEGFYLYQCFNYLIS